MKKYFFTAILFVILAFNSTAQQVIKGTYKYHGRDEKIYVKAIASSSGDKVSILEFAPLTRLENEVKDLRNTEARLRKELERYKSEKNNSNSDKINVLQDSIASLQRQIAVKDKQLSELKEDLDYLKKRLAECIRQSADSIMTLQAEINNLKLSSVKPSFNRDAVIVGGGINISKLSNNGIKDDSWTVGLPTGKEFELSWLHYFSQTSPVAIRVGVSYRELNGNAHCDMIRDTLFNMTDADNDTYDARYIFGNIAEQMTLKQLSVPVMLHMGNSYMPFGLKGWVEAGLAVAFNMATVLERSGNYSCEGYFPQWNVTITDVPDRGFVTDAMLTAPETAGVKSMTVWGQLAAGVYIPVSDIVGVEFGGMCGYSLLSVSGGDGLNGRRYDEETMMITDGGKTNLFSTAVKLGIVVHL